MTNGVSLGDIFWGGWEVGVGPYKILSSKSMTIDNLMSDGIKS